MLWDALKRSDVDAVTLVHSETSTGVLQPLEEIFATFARASGATERTVEIADRCTFSLY